MNRDVFRVRVLFFLFLGSLVILSGCGGEDETFDLAPKNNASYNFYTPFGTAIFDGDEPQAPASAEGWDFDFENLDSYYNGENFEDANYDLSEDEAKEIYNANKDNPSEIEVRVYPGPSTPFPNVLDVEYWYSGEGKEILNRFPSDVVCQVGGTYKGDLPYLGSPEYLEKIQVYEKDGGLFGSDVTHYISPPNIEHTEDLFDCSTTLDLMENIKLPQGWENDNLLAYCGDGERILQSDRNFGFIFGSFNIYKACLIKNLDKQENTLNTILYGLEVGNKNIDSSDEFKIDVESDHDTFNGLSLPVNFQEPYQQGEYDLYTFFTEGVDDNDPEDTYIFGRNSDSRMFYMYRNDIESPLETTFVELDTNLNSVYETDDITFDLARTVMLRTGTGTENQMIYGYDIPQRFIVKDEHESVKPVYQIYFKNFGNFETTCEESLAKYNPDNFGAGEGINKSTLVNCNQADVLINAAKFSGDDGFNLFKNIITNVGELGDPDSTTETQDYTIEDVPQTGGSDGGSVGGGNPGGGPGGPGSGTLPEEEINPQQINDLIDDSP